MADSNPPQDTPAESQAEDQPGPSRPATRKTKNDLIAELAARDAQIAELFRLIADLRNGSVRPSVEAEPGTELPAENPPRREATVETQATTPTDGKRSAKLPDPPIFYNEEDRDTDRFEQWYRDMENKLEVNADHFHTGRARQAYIESRLGGTAKRNLAPYLSATHPEPIRNPDRLLAHLWGQYHDPNKRQKSLDEYDDLKLRPGDDFLVFKNDFVRLSGETGKPRSSWKDDFYRKLYPGFQRSVASAFINATVSFDQFVLEAQQIALINKMASEKQNAARQPAASNGNKRGQKKLTSSGGTTGGARKDSNDPATKKLTPDEVQLLYREGRCFICRRKGHLSNQCPDKPAKAADPDKEARLKALQAKWAFPAEKPASKETAEPSGETTSAANRFEQSGSDSEN